MRTLGAWSRSIGVKSRAGVALIACHERSRLLLRFEIRAALEAYQPADGPHIDVGLTGRRLIAYGEEALEFSAHAEGVGEHVLESQTERAIDASVTRTGKARSGIGTELGAPAQGAGSADEAQTIGHWCGDNDAGVRAARLELSLPAARCLDRALAEIVVAELEAEVADELVADEALPGDASVVAAIDWNARRGQSVVANVGEV